MPTALVTGGAGFLGSHLCDRLVEDGDRVICVDSLETGSLQNVEHLRGDSFAFLNHDITEDLAVEECGAASSPFLTHDTTEHLPVEESIAVVYPLASPASPIDYLRLPLLTL